MSERQYCNCLQGGVCAGLPRPEGAQCKSAIGMLSKEPPKPHEILAEMAKTFEERGKIYGDNWKRIGNVLNALAGNQAVVIDGPEDWLRWSLYIMVVTKLTRLATTDLQHVDSVHDMSVYGAMWESILPKES